MLACVNGDFLKLPALYRSCLEFNASEQLDSKSSAMSVVAFTEQYQKSRDTSPVPLPETSGVENMSTDSAENGDEDINGVVQCDSENETDLIADIPTKAQVNFCTFPKVYVISIFHISLFASLALT